MRGACALPVTVKCRIGMDQRRTTSSCVDFVGYRRRRRAARFSSSTRARPGCPGCRPRRIARFRRCDYEQVYRLKHDLPALPFVPERRSDAARRRRRAAAVRRGHAGPRGLPRAGAAGPSGALVSAPAAEAGLRGGERHGSTAPAHGRGRALAIMTRHMLGLSHGQPGASRWRRTLSDASLLAGNDPALLDQAMAAMAAMAGARDHLARIEQPGRISAFLIDRISDSSSSLL